VTRVTRVTRDGNRGAPGSRAGSASWTELRYRVLLPLAARSFACGAAYARVVASIEYGRDARRRETAVNRISAWLGKPAADAAWVYHAALSSEAREEADAAYFMRRPEALARFLGAGGDAPMETGPVIYAGLHFGSPILAYLHLCRVRGLNLHAVGRRLDASNPMPAAKRVFGTAKVAWLESLAGRPLLDSAGDGLLQARAELVEGRSLYAVVDVPGDVVDRAADVEIGGERVRFAAGVTTLARLTRVPLRPFVGLRENGRLRVEYGPLVEPGEADATCGQLVDVMRGFVERWPSEWWLWPFVPASPDRGRDGGRS